MQTDLEYLSMSHRTILDSYEASSLGRRKLMQDQSNISSAGDEGRMMARASTCNRGVGAVGMRVCHIRKGVTQIWLPCESISVRVLLQS